MKLEPMEKLSPEYIEILKKMPPAKKLEAAENLYRTAWTLKAAGLSNLHPDWSAEKIHEETKKLFFYART
ncbi:MAG: hypothetical protein Q7T11_02225 [Deltaproteobacteria bacterium]|nr:hypothetical protein [Deltaproteobacteria bacterium]